MPQTYIDANISGTSGNGGRVKKKKKKKINNIGLDNSEHELSKELRISKMRQDQDDAPSPLQLEEHRSSPDYPFQENKKT